MNRGEVIAMVRDCGFAPDEVEISFCEIFVDLVAAREREACANIAYAWGSPEIERAIRARSNKGVNHG